MSERMELRLDQEEDRPAKRQVIAVAVAGVVITILAIYWSGWLLRRFEVELGILFRGRAAPPRAPAQISSVYQTLIDVDHEGPRLRAEQERILAGYGWVDRSQGKLRIPISRAIDLLIEKGGTP